MGPAYLALVLAQVAPFPSPTVPPAFPALQRLTFSTTLAFQYAPATTTAIMPLTLVPSACHLVWIAMVLPVHLVSVA